MNHSRNSVRKLTMLALLTAMSIVFARVLSISTGFSGSTWAACPPCWPLCCSGRWRALPWVQLPYDRRHPFRLRHQPLITLGAGSIA